MELSWLLIALGACLDSVEWAHGKDISAKTWEKAPPDWREWLDDCLAGYGGDGDGYGYGGDGYGGGYGDGYGYGQEVFRDIVSLVAEAELAGGAAHLIVGALLDGWRNP